MMTVQFLLVMAIIHPDQQSPFNDYRWQYRIIVINEKMDKSNEQLNLLLDKSSGLKDRELLVFLKKDEQLICQNADEEILEDTREGNSGIYLIGKDGGIKLQRESMVESQLIFDLIDSMPMRQSEMRRKSN